MNWNPWHADPQFLHPNLRVKPWELHFSRYSRVIVDISFLPWVSKLKPTSPCYLPYLDAFPGVVVPCIDPACRADMVRLLELGWRPDAVAEQLHVSWTTVYNTEHNLMRYGQPIRPCVRKAGRSAALTRADREALLKLLLHDSWKYLDEIQY